MTVPPELEDAFNVEDDAFALEDDSVEDDALAVEEDAFTLEDDAIEDSTFAVEADTIEDNAFVLDDEALEVNDDAGVFEENMCTVLETVPVTVSGIEEKVVRTVVVFESITIVPTDVDDPSDVFVTTIAVVDVSLILKVDENCEVLVATRVDVEAPPMPVSVIICTDEPVTIITDGCLLVEDEVLEDP
jgi:hypothetical protein